MNNQDTKLAKKIAILRQGFIPVMVDDGHKTEMLIESMAAAGCKVVDYTCRRKDVRKYVPWIKKEFPEMIILLGSLVDSYRASSYLSQTRVNFVTVQEAVDLGVDGLVSMLKFSPETYRKYRKDFIIVPCIETYNEALDQIELGADLVKLNGNNPLGPNFIASGSPTHSFIPFFVTGGMTDDRVIQYVKAGAAVVAGGFDLVIPEKLRKNESISVETLARALKNKCRTVKEARNIYQPDLFNALGKEGVNPFEAAHWIY